MRLDTSSGTGTGRMDRSSCDVCALWTFAIGRSPRDHPGKTLTLRGSLARSAGSAWTTSSCSGEAHLRRIVGAYVAYYNESRTHRSLDKDAPFHRAIQRFGAITPILQNLVFGTHAPLTAAATLTRSEACADHPFVRSAAHTQRKTERRCYAPGLLKPR